MPAMPHPHLIVLRSAATVVLSLVVAQAGFAAALLSGDDRLAEHSMGAWATLVATVATALLYLVLRRSAGPVNVSLAVVLAVAVSVQFSLGQVGERAWHIFLGVLIAMVATALTSWTYRHAMPGEPGR